jgi:hypothetical protein
MTVSGNVLPLYGNCRMLTVQRARSAQIGVAFQ